VACRHHDYPQTKESNDHPNRIPNGMPGGILLLMQSQIHWPIGLFLQRKTAFDLCHLRRSSFWQLSCCLVAQKQWECLAAAVSQCSAIWSDRVILVLLLVVVVADIVRSKSCVASTAVQVAPASIWLAALEKQAGWCQAKTALFAHVLFSILEGYLLCLSLLVMIQSWQQPQSAGGVAHNAMLSLWTEQSFKLSTNLGESFQNVLQTLLWLRGEFQPKLRESFEHKLKPVTVFSCQTNTPLKFSPVSAESGEPPLFPLVLRFSSVHQDWHNVFSVPSYTLFLVFASLSGELNPIVFLAGAVKMRPSEACSPQQSAHVPSLVARWPHAADVDHSGGNTRPQIGWDSRLSLWWQQWPDWANIPSGHNPQLGSKTNKPKTPIDQLTCKLTDSCSRQLATHATFCCH